MLKRIVKRALTSLLIILVVSIALLGYSFLPARLDVNTYKSGDAFQPLAVTDPSALPQVTLSVIECGKMKSRQSFVFLGGSWSEEYSSGMAAVLIRHPKATLLFDCGFGANVDEHFKNAPRLMRALTSYDKETNAARQLGEHGILPSQINRIILSHWHWDHVSGAEDFPGVEVLVSKTEEEHIRTLSAGELISQLRGRLNLHSFDFTGGPYENFDRSYDMFSDGSLVLVPLPGHTPGSTGLFVNLHSGKRFFFIGDLTWAIEGVKLPAERPWVSRKLVDQDEEQVRRSIVKVHQLLERRPDLIIVPAHDRRIHDQIANFPEVER
jgi:glyoxylase-like metal-dependent hydrolase (beta-lactamase superfamily II)